MLSGTLIKREYDILRDSSSSSTVLLILLILARQGNGCAGICSRNECGSHSLLLAYSSSPFRACSSIRTGRKSHPNPGLHGESAGSYRSHFHKTLRYSSNKSSRIRRVRRQTKKDTPNQVLTTEVLGTMGCHSSRFQSAPGSIPCRIYSQMYIG